MRYISAPWRDAYVRTVHTMKGCVLCRALKIGDDRKARILYRGRTCFIVLNKYPYVPGHLMIAPFRHLAVFERSNERLSAELADLLKLSLRVLKKTYAPQGFNIGMNLGRSAGAGVVDHYHLHVVPRWTGDSNFMPIVSRAKVVLEDLDTTFSRLVPHFQRMGRKGR